jgi:hypothetical protein
VKVSPFLLLNLYIMTINQNKEDLNRAIELLRDALKYGLDVDHWLYSNISEFLNQIEENDTRKE